MLVVECVCLVNFVEYWVCVTVGGGLSYVLGWGEICMCVLSGEEEGGEKGRERGWGKRERLWRIWDAEACVTQGIYIHTC